MYTLIQVTVKAIANEKLQSVYIYKKKKLKKSIVSFNFEQL